MSDRPEALKGSFGKQARYRTAQKGNESGTLLHAVSQLGKETRQRNTKKRETASAKCEKTLRLKTGLTKRKNAVADEIAIMSTVNRSTFLSG